MASTSRLSKQALAAFCLGMITVITIATIFVLSDDLPFNPIVGLRVLFVVAVFAVIFGHLGEKSAAAWRGTHHGHMLASTGLVIGYLYAGVFILLLFAPSFEPNPVAAHEAVAVGTLRNINEAEASFFQHSSGKYSCSLTELKTQLISVDPYLSDRLYDSFFESGAKAGYRSQFLECGKTGYQVAAAPRKFGKTGRRTFCSDQTQVIRYIMQGSEEECIVRGKPLE